MEHPGYQRSGRRSVSWQAQKWAHYSSPTLLTEKGKPDTVANHVLTVLAEHADEAGRNAYPSVLRIRFATRLDERTIDRVLRRLRHAGLIELAGRTHEGTRIWNLNMNLTRPESEWDDMVAEADKTRERESAARNDRRHRSSCADSEV